MKLLQTYFQLKTHVDIFIFLQQNKNSFVKITNCHCIENNNNRNGQKQQISFLYKIRKTKTSKQIDKTNKMLKLLNFVYGIGQKLKAFFI